MVHTRALNLYNEHRLQAKLCFSANTTSCSQKNEGHLQFRELSYLWSNGFSQNSSVRCNLSQEEARKPSENYYPDLNTDQFRTTTLFIVLESITWAKSLDWSPHLTWGEISRCKVCACSMNNEWSQHLVHNLKNHGRDIPQQLLCRRNSFQSPKREHLPCFYTEDLKLCYNTEWSEEEISLTRARSLSVVQLRRSGCRSPVHSSWRELPQGGGDGQHASAEDESITELDSDMAYALPWNPARRTRCDWMPPCISSSYSSSCRRSSWPAALVLRGFPCEPVATSVRALKD